VRAYRSPKGGVEVSNEHLLGSVARESLALMAGIWWDLGDSAAKILSDRAFHTLRATSNCD
jgi:hypothetical protein